MPEKDILSRGRPSVAVNIKDPRGVEVVLELVEKADVLIEGFRPGVTDASASARTTASPATRSSSTDG